MKTMIEKLQELADADLYALCEAVDQELLRRDGIGDEDDSQSARGRVVDRKRSYRRRAGSAAPPVRIIGFPNKPPKRAA